MCLLCASLDRGEEGWGGKRLPEGQYRTEARLLPHQPAAGDLRRTSRRCIKPPCQPPSLLLVTRLFLVPSSNNTLYFNFNFITLISRILYFWCSPIKNGITAVLNYNIHCVSTYLLLQLKGGLEMMSPLPVNLPVKMFLCILLFCLIIEPLSTSHKKNMKAP